MKKIMILIVGIPILLLMTVMIPVGFIYEALAIGFNAGRSFFDDYNDLIRKS